MAGLRAGEGILRRRPIEHIGETEVGGGFGLERTLGLWQLTAIGVGAGGPGRRRGPGTRPGADIVRPVAGLHNGPRTGGKLPIRLRPS